MSGWFEYLEKTFESTFHHAHQVAGVCNSPDSKQVKDLLVHAETLTKIAKTSTSFVNSTQVLGQAGEQLAGAADTLARTTKLAGDVNAACEISEAVAVLNQWVLPGAKRSNEDAAKAFDKLIGGAGRYMGKLPPPANVYGKIFTMIGEYKLLCKHAWKNDEHRLRSHFGCA